MKHDDGAAAPQGGGTMRLSEAIRLGAMLRPQARGSLRSRRFFGLFGSKTTCAMGAAYEAAGCETKLIPLSTPIKHKSHRGGYVMVTHVVDHPDEWTPILNASARCPECHRLVEPVYRLIPHLNDDHRWTRERIADWVATIEPDAGAPSQARERVGAEGDAREVRHG